MIMNKQTIEFAVPDDIDRCVCWWRVHRELRSPVSYSGFIPIAIFVTEQIEKDYGWL